MNVPVKQEGISYKNVQIASHGGGGMLMPQNFGEVVAFSEIMARSQHAIPKHLRDVPGACLAVVMQSLRWEFDPFAVASKSYNVKDIIAYEAQLIAAVVHTRAPIKTRPDYAYTGEGQDRRCTVSALFNDGITRSYESPRIADITVKNSPLWKADPDQQLSYYSIRAFARRYCPEVILGVYTPEEAEQFRGPDHAKDVTPRQSLSERLAVSSAAGEGFSQDHVINEIDGNSNSNSSVAAPPAPSAQMDAPATDDASPADTVAGNNSNSSDEVLSPGDAEVQAGDDASSASLPSTLAVDWQDTYLTAMSRVTDKPKSLPNRHAEAIQIVGGSANEDEKRWMRAAYNLTKFRIENGQPHKLTKDDVEAELNP